MRALLVYMRALLVYMRALLVYMRALLVYMRALLVYMREFISKPPCIRFKKSSRTRGRGAALSAC